jgi:lipopolysaccharide export system protein LptA
MRAVLFALAIAASPGHAQTAIGFEGLRQDPSAPVEVASDALTVEQAAGRAVFTGNVVVAQGDLRLAAATVTVDYAADGAGIRRITAGGGVTFATATDAAEAREAVYEVETGALTLTGDVVLTQGPATITGDRLVADLRAGTGRIEGRVRTVFRPGASD